MARGRFDYPTPAMDPADRDHSRCPVCGWSPCTETCRLGLSPLDVVELSMLFPDLPAQNCHDEGHFEGNVEDDADG